MSKELKNLKTNLSEVEYPENSWRGKQAENRSKSRGREMGEQGNLGLGGLSITAGGSKSETVSKIKTLRGRQSYILTSEATEEDGCKADGMTFMDWMIKIHDIPNDKKDWDKKFYDEVSPLLEEMERSIRAAIKISDEICLDNDTLVSNPTVNGTIDLLEKSKNHIRRCTTVRNTDITKICFEFHSSARTFEAA